MKKELRDYQIEAYRAIVKSIANGGRPYANLSTGSGKSLVCAILAEKCMKQGGRALILVPSSELVTQNAKEFMLFTSDVSSFGICSAKLGKYQINKQIVFATYTSFLKKRATSGGFNILIIDECHYLAPKPDTSYQKIIKSLLRINPNMKICGMSATPYREKQGFLHLDSIEGAATFTECAYETNIPDLIKKGYLSHVESISGDIEADMSGVRLKSNGDYNDEEMGQRFENIVAEAVPDMRSKFEHYGIKTALVYASNLSNARKIVAEWGDSSTIRLAHGDMPNSERHALTRWLKEGEGLRVVVNVGIFVTGFDFPPLDCVVFFLSTMSLIKYVQICGRVIRAHDEKDVGYVLCYGGNIARHGPIDSTIAPKNKKRRGEVPKKPCLSIIDETILFEGITYRVGDVCNYPNSIAAKKCRVCGAVFISEGAEGKYVMRSRAEILAEQVEQQKFVYEVSRIVFEEAISKDGTPMIKARFIGEDSEELHSEYFCLQHTGSARGLAIAKIKSLMKAPHSDWYQIGKFDGGHNVKNMLFLLNDFYWQYFKMVKTITLVRDGRFNKLLNWGF